MGTAKHVDVVVKTQHETPDTQITGHFGGENPVVGCVGWSDISFGSGVFFYNKGNALNSTQTLNHANH